MKAKIEKLIAENGSDVFVAIFKDRDFFVEIQLKDLRFKIVCITNELTFVDNSFCARNEEIGLGNFNNFVDEIEKNASHALGSMKRNILEYAILLSERSKRSKR